MLDLDVGIVFHDTTSLHFEIDEEDASVGEDDKLRDSRSTGCEGVPGVWQTRTSKGGRRSGNRRRSTGAIECASGPDRPRRLPHGVCFESVFPSLRTSRPHGAARRFPLFGGSRSHRRRLANPSELLAYFRMVPGEVASDRAIAEQ